MQPVTHLLAEAASSYRFEKLPEEVVLCAKHCFLDWLGVTIAGARQPLTRILLAEARSEGGAPQASVIGERDRVALLQAALINGAASHALDYDDVHMSMGGHPSVSVFPALLALAELQDDGGASFLTAFVAGFEIECRTGALVNPGHYAAGFHATGTVGTFGAAACAWLMHLSPEQWLCAFGIAGTQAAGLKSMFGTMCKPLHAGKAAQNGLLAARLAARGFTANQEVLETAQGFGTTLAPALAPERALARLGETFAIRNVLFKYHAACYETHAAIEGINRLRRRHAIAPQSVRKVHLRVSPGHLSICNIAEPRSGLEGKFSLRFTAALALAGEQTSEAAFTDDRVRDPALTALRDKVAVEADQRVPGGRTEVTLLMADGSELRETVDMTKPAADLGDQGRRLVAKFTGLAAPVLGATRADQLVSIISRLQEVGSIREVTRLCVPEAGAEAGQ